MVKLTLRKENPVLQASGHASSMFQKDNSGYLNHTNKEPRRRLPFHFPLSTTPLASFPNLGNSEGMFAFCSPFHHCASSQAPPKRCALSPVAFGASLQNLRTWAPCKQEVCRPNSRGALAHLWLGLPTPMKVKAHIRYLRLSPTKLFSIS